MEDDFNRFDARLLNSKIALFSSTMISFTVTSCSSMMGSVIPPPVYKAGAPPRRGFAFPAAGGSSRLSRYGIDGKSCEKVRAMTNQRKPGWALWTTLALIVLVMYPLSFGPACWIASRHPRREMVLAGAYRPLSRVALACPWQSVFRALLTWGELGEQPPPHSWWSVAKSTLLEVESTSLDGP